MIGEVMTSALSQEQEQLVAQAMQSRGCQDADYVIARALELLRAEDGWLPKQGEAVSGKIERAFEQFERGEFFTDQQSRADMEQRKAAWLHGRSRYRASRFDITAGAQNTLFLIWRTGLTMNFTRRLRP